VVQFSGSTILYRIVIVVEIARNHNARQRRRLAMKVVYQFQAIHVGELDVHKRELKGPRLQDLKGLQRTLGDGAAVPIQFNDTLKGPTHIGFVVDNEHT
jgi:hypothetical protein